MSHRECQEVSGRTATRGANIPVFLLNFFRIKVRLYLLASVRVSLVPLETRQESQSKTHSSTIILVFLFRAPVEHHQ
jgi:hypothetical protein